MANVNATIPFEGGEAKAGIGEWTEVEAKHAKLEDLPEPYSKVQVRLVNAVIVQFRGGVAVKNAESISQGESLFTIPAGFRSAEVVNTSVIWLKEGAGLNLVTGLAINGLGNVAVEVALPSKSRVYLTGVLCAKA